MAQDQRYRTVLLIGAPGAGKGTVGSTLGRVPGFYHCSTGDIFRNIDIRSDLGKIFFEYSSRGELVPDDVTVKMWAESIRAYTVLSIYKPQVDLLVLDGLPRTIEQAKLVEDYVEVLKIVHMTCTDEEEMFKRIRRRALKANRFDDADDKVIRHRWQVYEEETQPLLDFYSKDKIVEVDSLQSPATVLHDVLGVVIPVQDAHFATFEG